MANKKQIQFPRFVIKKYKAEAIDTMTNYINENIDDFVDGEEITIRYLDYKDGESLRSINGIIDIKLNESNEKIASLSVEIGEHDTVKILESENEPEDKKSLWLTDWSHEEPYPASDLKSEVIKLKLELKAMREMLNKHDYALSNTIAGGDIITNSEKYELENQYDKEQPEDSDIKPTYDTGDTEVYTWGIYLGKSDLRELIEDDKYEFYRKMKYFLKLRLFNKEGKEIEETEDITLHLVCDSQIATIDENRVLFAEEECTATLTATLYQYGEKINSINYGIIFKKNEKPDYEVYGEPNVHHILVKTAPNFDTLQQNFDYLCVNELCWCINESSLYLKAKDANGNVKLFKINGQGSITPTGETESITYRIDEDGFIDMNDEYTGKYIFLDEEGFINVLAGNIDEEGYIVLTDTAPNNLI